jgi:hypothetical protein
MSQAVIASNQSIKIQDFSPTYSGTIADLTDATLFTNGVNEYIDIFIASYSSFRTAGGYGYTDTVQIKVVSSNTVELYKFGGISGVANPAAAMSASPQIKIPPGSTVSIRGYNNVNGYTSSTYTIKFVGTKFINSP